MFICYICFVFIYKNDHKKLDKYAKMLYYIKEEVSEYTIYTEISRIRVAFRLCRDFLLTQMHIAVTLLP